MGSYIHAGRFVREVPFEELGRTTDLNNETMFLSEGRILGSNDGIDIVIFGEKAYLVDFLDGRERAYLMAETATEFVEHLQRLTCAIETKQAWNDFTEELPAKYAAGWAYWKIYFDN